MKGITSSMQAFASAVVFFVKKLLTVNRPVHFNQFCKLSIYAAKLKLIDPEYPGQHLEESASPQLDRQELPTDFAMLINNSFSPFRGRSVRLAISSTVSKVNRMSQKRSACSGVKTFFSNLISTPLSVEGTRWGGYPVLWLLCNRFHHS